MRWKRVVWAAAAMLSVLAVPGFSAQASGEAGQELSVFEEVSVTVGGAIPDNGGIYSVPLSFYNRSGHEAEVIVSGFKEADGSGELGLDDMRYVLESCKTFETILELPGEPRVIGAVFSVRTGDMETDSVYKEFSDNLEATVLLSMDTENSAPMFGTESGQDGHDNAVNDAGIPSGQFSGSVVKVPPSRLKIFTVAVGILFIISVPVAWLVIKKKKWRE